MLGLVYRTLLVVLLALAWPLAAAAAPSIVDKGGIARGTILIKTNERKLYYGLGNGKAVVYPVGVGRSGRRWTGQRFIYAKVIRPAWRATAEIRKDKPGLTNTIPGGSPKNPMGAAALLISGKGQYAIHGTNNPGSIGKFVSYGCIRMHNRDVMDLYRRVGYGTRVVVVR